MGKFIIVDLNKFNHLPCAEWCIWFSGFVDGEGSFNIRLYKERSNIAACHFHLNLRADDKKILEEIQSHLGGTLILDKSKHIKWAPQYKLNIVSKTNIARLINLFDAYPLKTKKRRDYELWRQAAIKILSCNYQIEEIIQIKFLLEQGRKYNETLANLPKLIWQQKCFKF